MPQNPGAFANLRLVLALRALERADDAGEFLPQADRRAWSRDAGLDGLPAHPSAGRVLEKLGERARIANGARLPWTVRPVLLGLSGCDLHGGWLTLMVLVAAVAGAASLHLDGGRSVNLLGLPLVLLIGWNLLVYLWLLVRGVVAFVGPRRSGLIAGCVSSWSGARVAIKRLQRERGDTSATWGEILDFGQRAIEEWRRSFLDLAGPVLRRRFFSIVHLAALAWAAGAIGSLYYQGWSTSYLAYWESTILDVNQAKEFLTALFLPASLVFSLPLPVDEIARLQWVPGSGNAPEASALPWFQLYGGTLLLFVIIPRAVLFVLFRIAGVIALQRAVCSPLLRAYFGEVRGVDAGEPAKPAWHIGMRGEASSLSDASRAAITRWGADNEAFGAAEYVALHLMVSDEERARAIRRLDALVIGMEQTPDDAVRTDLGFLRDAAEREDAVKIVFLDAGWFFERFAELPGLDTRWREREAAWREAVGVHPVRPVFLRVKPEMKREAKS